MSLDELVAGAVARALAEQLPAAVAQALAKVSGGADGYVTIHRAAAHVGVSASFLRGEARSGRLSARKCGRSWRVRLADVEALLAAPAVKPAAVDLEARADALLAVKPAKLRSIGGGR